MPSVNHLAAVLAHDERFPGVDAIVAEARATYDTLTIPATPEQLREICEDFAGHEYEPAGGGLLICTRCEGEKWEDTP